MIIFNSWISTARNQYTRTRVAIDLVFFDYTQTVLVNENSCPFAIVDFVAPKCRVATGSNFNTRKNVSINLVVFNQALTFCVNLNSITFAVVDFIFKEYPAACCGDGQETVLRKVAYSACND